MTEVKEDLKREKVRIVEISKIKDFPNHPFLVKDDESMAQLVNSIRMNGVLNPVIARRIDDDHYELNIGKLNYATAVISTEALKKGIFSIHEEQETK